MKHSSAAESCSSLPTLDDLALLAAVDGEADAAIYNHLAHCPACAARAQAFAELQAQLRSRLFRLFCSSSEELVAFHQGMLDPGRQTEIAQHLGQCIHCQNELHILGAMLSQSPPSSPPGYPKDKGAGPADNDCR